jgi:3-oxoacyl-[acyl-carrier-protein] synthase III
MVRPPVGFGIVGVGLCLGEDQDLNEVAGTCVNDPYRVAWWGYHTFHRAPAGTTSIAMAAQAAECALADTTTDARCRSSWICSSIGWSR